MKKIYFTITGRKYHDGKRNGSEHAADFMLFTSFMEENEKTELEMSGLNPDELEFMKACERREVLAQAGLNPDEYDF